MKIFILLAVAALALVQVSALTDEQKQFIKDTRKHCIDETKVETSVLKKFAEGSDDENDKLKDYILCFFKKTGVITDGGDFNKESIKTKTTAMFGQETSDKIVAECLEKKDSPKNTAWSYAKCSHKFWPADYPKSI